MSLFIFGVGFLLVVEGLVLALAPNIYEEMIEMIRTMPPDRRRAVGLVVAIGGAVLLWIATRSE